jgi:chromosomal replication initiator protein
MKAVEAHFNVRNHELIGSSRRREVARPRQIVMYLAKELTNSSYPNTGRCLGNRDHSTVIHGFRQIEHLVGVDPDLKAHVRHLVRLLAPERELPAALR